MFNLDRAADFLARLPIRDKLSQRLVPFVLNPSQRKLHAALRAQNDRGKPMRAVVLKARRQGISTYTDNLLAVHGISKSGVNGQIITHDYRSSKELFKAPRTLVSESVGKEKPLKSIINMPPFTQHKLTFGHADGDSFLSIATAGNVSGGRGLSLTDCHCSEAAYYPGEDTFSALIPTVPRAPDTIIVVETTANGRTGIGEIFYNFWQASVKGDTEFAPIFLSWLIDPTCVDYDHPVDDAPRDDDEKMLMKEGVNIDGKIFRASKEQIAWRRVTIDSPACRGYVEIFDQEFPYSPECSFISTGSPAFTKEELSIARNSLQPYTGTTGSWPKRVEIAGESGGDSSHIYCKENSVSPVYQWEPPQPKHRYYFGVDAARGKDEGDFAAIVGVDGETGNQVLRYAQRVDPEYLARLCHYIGHYYNKAMLCIELTGNLGLWCQMRLRDYFHYPNLYKWRGTRDDKIAPHLSSRSRGGSYGWETTYRSRERLLITFRESILHRMVTIRDEEVVRQMDVATRKDSWERWEINCLPGDSLVLSNPSFSEIGKLQPGQKVITHTGNYREIQQVMRRGYKGELVALHVVGQGRSEKIKLTPEHPIYTRRFAWDHMNFPSVSRKRSAYPPIFCPVALARPGDYVFLPKRKNLPVTQFADDVLRVMGWYLSEGSLTGQRRTHVVFSVHEKERAQLEEISQILMKYDPPNPIRLQVKRANGKVHAWTRPRAVPRVEKCKGTYTGTQVRGIRLIYWSPYWAALLREHCGEYSHHKRLSEEVFGSSGLLPLVRAWMEGDGCFARSRHHPLGNASGSSVSVILIRQLRQILLDHGIWSTVTHPRKQAIQRLNIAAKDLTAFGRGYKFNPVVPKFVKNEVIQDQDGFWTRIRSVDVEEFDGEVCNLAVDGDQSYVAGIAVHNCGHDDILMSTMLANISRSEWHPRAVEGATSRVSTDAQQDSRILAKLNPQTSFEHLGSVTAGVYKQLLKDRARYDQETEARWKGWR